MAEIRIIAGQYRRRKIRVIEAPDLRPTADRARETLFNWLQPYIQDAICLDAFAGSGALGFEACSRGAQQVSLVEFNKIVFQQLQSTQALLNCSTSSLVHTSIMDWLPQQTLRFDIIFLDPPFRNSQILNQLLVLLTTQDALTAEGLVYVEKPLAAQDVPLAWQDYAECIRQQRVGQSQLELWRKISSVI